MKPLSEALPNIGATSKRQELEPTKQLMQQHGSTKSDGQSLTPPTLPSLEIQEVVKNLPTISRGKRGRTLLESLLDNREINWVELPFECYSNHGGIPVLRKGSEAHIEAVAQERALQAKLLPVLPEAMAVVLYRLQGHYWQTGMSETLAKLVAEDYARLLGSYPLVAFQTACDKWLMNPESKFFPKVGELDKLLRHETYVLKWRHKQLEKLLEKAE